MATKNTLNVLRLNTPFTYIVQSVKNSDIENSNNYTVNTHKMSCTCPHGQHTQGVSARPCKHITFCKKIEQDSQLKNFYHYNLAQKGIKVAKITKITRIFKSGKKTKIVAVTYITEHGKKACCFMNTESMKREKFFEIYENRPNEDGGRTLKVSLSGNLDTTLRYTLGYQFDLVFKEGGYTKFTYGDAGIYRGFKSIDIYEAMTSILLPEYCDVDYLNFVRNTKKIMMKAPIDDSERTRVLNSYFQCCGVNLYYLVGYCLDSIKRRAEERAYRSITWDSLNDVTEYKKQVAI